MLPVVDYICYVVNKQRDDGKSRFLFTHNMTHANMYITLVMHETIRLHQKNYFESLEDVYKKLESLDEEKKNLLASLEDQKRLSEETFKQEMAFVHDAMRRNEYQLRVTNAALDETTSKMNDAYDSFTENNRKVNNEISDLVAVDNVLIEKMDRLQFPSRNSYVPASIRRACQTLKITKRPNTQPPTSRKNCMLQAHVLELSANVGRLNEAVYGQASTAQQASPPSPSSVGASTSASSMRVNMPSSSSSSPSTKSNFKKSIRKSYDRMVNGRKRASLASMVSSLKINLGSRQHQSSSNDISDASTSSSSNDLASTSGTLESRVDSLHIAFNNQLKDIHTRIDQLASKVKKSSKHSQAISGTGSSAPGGSSSSSNNNQQNGDQVPLDMQIVILRDQVTGFHKEFINMGKDYKKNVETLYRDIAAVSIKQKELDTENRSRWAAYDQFYQDTRDQFVEIFSRYEATTAFQMKKIADVSNYSECNIQLLHDTTKTHQDSLASLAHTLQQLQPSGKARATTATTTSVVLHEKQQRQDRGLLVPSAAKFINHMESALRSDKAILDHNSKKLHALHLKLESSRDVENLKVQRELVDREFDRALKQIALIKKRIEPEFENPPPLQQNGESSTATINQRRDQLLRQVHVNAPN